MLWPPLEAFTPLLMDVPKMFLMAKVTESMMGEAKSSVTLPQRLYKVIHVTSTTSYTLEKILKLGKHSSGEINLFI